MCETEKIYANDKVSVRRIEEENAKKKLESNRKGADITNGKTVSVHLDGERKSHTSPTHTREQRAKIAGVSAGTVARYNTKEEAMKWMLDIQLGRRNLSPIQRIAVTEKYRPIYEKQAQENQSKAGGDKKSKSYQKSLTENLPQAISSKERNPTTDKKLSDIAGVSEKTYRMGAKVLNSDNEDIKQRVLSSETSISANRAQNYALYLFKL